MSLDIIFGPMFSRKTSKIISLVSRHMAIGMSVLVIKHSSDSRYPYSEDHIVTHDQRRCVCSATATLTNPALSDRIRDSQVIIVDEAQFFQGLVEFARYAVEDLGKKVYIVGLDGDSNRKPFGELLDCIPLADRIEKLAAFCQPCANGTPGIFTHRKNGPRDQQVIIGQGDMYQALCRRCYLQQPID